MARPDVPNVQPGQVYAWAGKRWRVVRVDGGRVHIVNVAKADNTATMPLSQFRDWRAV